MHGKRNNEKNNNNKKTTNHTNLYTYYTNVFHLKGGPVTFSIRNTCYKTTNTCVFE